MLYVGDEKDGNRYVKVNDSKQVYTIPETSLTEITEKKVSDFYSLTVNYLTVNNLDSLEVQSEDGTHTVQVTREEEKASYALDGKEIEETVFTTFYNKLINMAGQERFVEEYKPDKPAAFTFDFTDTEGQKATVSYYEYDSSFYAAVTGDKVYLVNKMDVRDLADAYQEMLNADSSEKSKEAEKNTEE